METTEYPIVFEDGNFTYRLDASGYVIGVLKTKGKKKDREIQDKDITSFWSKPEEPTIIPPWLFLRTSAS